MRLELIAEKQGGHADAFSSERWVLEQGQRRLGRSCECDWRVSEEETSVSPIHCIIKRRDDRFVLEDRSSGGSAVDGATLMKGAETIIRDQSVIDLGKLTFRAMISRQRSPDRDEADPVPVAGSQALTISAILSDIVPAGDIAAGPLGPREVADPLAFIQKPRPGTPSSRHVEIGWSGPPAPQNPASVLPENWWEESGAEADLGHSLEHSAATRVSVGISRAARPGATLEAGTDAPADLDADPARDVIPLEQMESLLRQLELGMEQVYSVMQLRAPSSPAAPRLPTEGGDTLALRLEAILTQQAQLNATLERMFSESARLFDPRMVELRAVSWQSRFLGWMKEAAYWRFYRSQFESGNGRVSAADLLRRSYLTAEAQDSARTSKAGTSKQGKTPK